MRRRILILLAVALACAIAAAESSAASGQTYAIHLDATGCPVPFAGGVGVAIGSTSSPRCGRRLPAQVVPVTDDLIVVRERFGWDVFRRRATGGWARVGGPSGCFARPGCLALRGVQDNAHAVARDGVIYALSSGIAVVRIAPDGTVSQPEGAAGCVVWVAEDGCTLGRPRTSSPMPMIDRVTIGDDAIYVGVDQRVDVMTTTPEGLVPVTGAGGCLSRDGTDGVGGSCVRVARGVGALGVVPLAGRVAVLSQVTDPRCGACTEVALFPVVPGTGAIEDVAPRCIGVADGCLEPHATGRSAFTVQATDEQTGLVVVGDRAADVIAFDGTGAPRQAACATKDGSLGCTAVGHGISATVAAGAVLGFATDDGVVALLDREPSTEALTPRTGLDACLGWRAPCHRALRRQASARAWLRPDGAGYIVDPDLGMLDLAPQAAPACRPGFAIETWSGAERTAVAPCADPNGDPVGYRVVAQPRIGSLRTTADGAIFRGVPHDDGGRVRADRPLGRRPRSDGGRRGARGAAARAAHRSGAARATARPLPRRAGLQRALRRGAPAEREVPGRPGPPGARRPGRGRRRRTRAPDRRAERRRVVRDHHVERAHAPARSVRVRGRDRHATDELLPGNAYILVSPSIRFDEFYRIEGDELVLRGRILPQRAARLGAMRSEVLVGRRWRRLARVPLSPGGRFALRTPRPGRFRIVWLPRRRGEPLNGVTWTVSLSPPSAPWARAAPSRSRARRGSRRAPSVALAPPGEPTLRERAAADERDPERRQHDHGGEDAVGAQVVRREQDQVAEPVRRADPLAEHGADDRERRRDAQAAEDGRHGAGQLDVEEHATQAGAEGAVEVEQVGLGPAQRVAGGDRDREERDERDHDHARRERVAEPERERGRDRRDGHGLARDEEQAQGATDDRREVHRDREREPEHRGDEEAEGDLEPGLAGGRREHAGVVDERARDQGRRRQHGRPHAARAHRELGEEEQDRRGRERRGEADEGVPHGVDCRSGGGG